MYWDVVMTVATAVPEASKVCGLKAGVEALLVVNSSRPKVTDVEAAAESGRRSCASW